MKIAAVCCTFLRPKQLGYLIQCFLKQDYPARKRELVILDDAGQYNNQQGDGWRLISSSTRYHTLGEKRNAATALVSGDVDAIAVWDDDDLYLPWALRSSVEALEIAPWSRPSVVLHPEEDGSLRQHETLGLFHGGWAYSREAFNYVGGYPAMNNGEDQGLALRFSLAGVKDADPIQLERMPFYVYSWGSAGGWHLSGMGPDGYHRLGERLSGNQRQLGAQRTKKTRLVITDPPHLDLHSSRVLPGVRPRKF
jgi:glycosyltransferase involved in cell wall biosynthesis